MASTMTYLEIVNRAIQESKAVLDPLTTSNFADPPRTRLYGQFKDWVNTAYTELMEDRPEWFFRKERATLSVYPRLYLTGVVDTISAGDILVSNISNITVTVQQVLTHEEAEGNGSTEITIALSGNYDSSLNSILENELFSRTSPTVTANIARYGGPGRYDFSELLPGLREIDERTVRISYIPTDAQARNSTYDSNLFTVVPHDWVYWPSHYDKSPWSDESLPTTITMTPQGSMALYPQPDKELLISFDYTREITDMVLHSDTPEALPVPMHMYLVWKTVEEFADFDNNTVLFRRAKKHLTKFDYWLARDYLPTFKYGHSLFNRG